MNRIYQGRVRSAELVVTAATKKKPEEPAPLPDWEQRLWDHHVIFQSAVNYYLLALAALAVPESATDFPGDSGRVIEQLRSQVCTAWEKFPRPSTVNALSLRDSVVEWIGLGEGASFDEAIAKVLEGNNASAHVQVQALAQLLEQCSGDAAVQQGGRGYLPLFCEAKTGANFKSDSVLIQRAWDMEALPVVIHRQVESPDTKLLDRFGIYSLATPDNKRPTLDPTKAKKRLHEAVKALASEGLITAEDAKRLYAIADKLPDDFTLPNYVGSSAKGAVKLRLYALIIYKYLERSQVTLQALRQVFPVPKENAVLSGPPNISELGDDPVKLARGKRGYVFPAFTALPRWNPSSPGEPAWKEFDIAAFKEALKGLNQFNQKTQERAEKNHNLRGELAILLGSPLSDWKPAKTESGEDVKRPVPLDMKLFERARELETALTGMLDDVVLGEETSETFGEVPYKWREGEWQISVSSLRGLGEIIEEWQKVFKKAEGEPAEADLVNLVKTYQADEKNQRKIGSVPLFLTLSEKRFWPLWLKPDGDTEPSDYDDEHAPTGGAGFLKKMADFHRTFREFQRSKEPINLTPAEPVHSRRLYMFSDLTDKAAKVSFSEQDGETFVSCALAMNNEEGQVSETRVRLRYSGRRMLRDELQGGTQSRWLQPMTKALRLPPPEKTESEKFDSAVALMPEFPKGRTQGSIPADRFLLNFPVNLDTGHIHTFLGKAATWKGQFNGTRDKNLHLHWPWTFSKKAKAEPWWNNPNLIATGFTTLSVDLGQRTAGAWALLRVTSWDPRDRSQTKRPVREIGHDGTRTWFAEVLNTGLLRLPGEDQRVRGKDGKLAEEHYGKKGRYAREHEWEAALELARALKADSPESWVGTTHREKSMPEQNDSLIALTGRRLSRLNTFHRWSCFAPDAEAVGKLDDNRIKKLKDELSHWQDDEVMRWKALLEQGDLVGFSQAAGEGFKKLQAELEKHLVTLANRAVPLRGRSWLWREKTKPEGLYRELVDAGQALQGEKIFIRGQRGLTLARIEQLENLRKLFLRHNRSFDRKPREKAKFGAEDRGRESGEPCEQLLQKIERMKEQRINQTAHLILAEALGVRLRAHTIDASERCRRDIHGEYEAIPGRQPVDFIVIENLDRYLANQGRARSENSRLMKWAHRAVRDKIKMLAEEPFGIPVVETAAAYSSQFCSKYGHAGARCEELSELKKHIKESLEKRSKESSKPGKPTREDYQDLLKQFEELEKLNQKRTKPSPYSLYLPKKGGPLFVSLPGGKPQQADVNAAINIGLRAVAAPAALDILHKVRAEKVGEGKFRPVQKNAREKAAFNAQSEIEMAGGTSAKLAKASAPNFFYDGAALAKYDRAAVTVNDSSLPLASGVGLWGTVKTRFPSRLIAINDQRLKHWKRKLSGEEEDDVPYS